MTLSEIKEKLHLLAGPLLESRRAFLVDVAIRNERGVALLQVFVDTDLGIKVGECSEISRELGKVLDEAGFFERPYHLEVSSPGIDKPLRLLRQYHKNVGRRFKVAYRLEGKPATLIGKLESILDDRLTFSPENGEPLTLEFSQIIESKEELPW